MNESDMFHKAQGPFFRPARASEVIHRILQCSLAFIFIITAKSEVLYARNSKASICNYPLDPHLMDLSYLGTNKTATTFTGTAPLSSFSP